MLALGRVQQTFQREQHAHINASGLQEDPGGRDQHCSLCIGVYISALETHQTPEMSSVHITSREHNVVAAHLLSLMRSSVCGHCAS